VSAADQEAARRLVAIKALHTMAWTLFAASTVGIPISAAAGRFGWALALAGLVLVEVLILAFNGMRCPLTAVAARYTTERRANFDIFLPEWLARYNKEIFGTLYLLGMLYAVSRWRGWVG
jgi:hypothetical protein